MAGSLEMYMYFGGKNADILIQYPYLRYKEPRQLERVRRPINPVVEGMSGHRNTLLARKHLELNKGFFPYLSCMNQVNYLSSTGAKGVHIACSRSIFK